MRWKPRAVGVRLFFLCVSDCFAVRTPPLTHLNTLTPPRRTPHPNDDLEQSLLSGVLEAHNALRPLPEVLQHHGHRVDIPLHELEEWEGQKGREADQLSRAMGGADP
jgi:hypothetical protein